METTERNLFQGISDIDKESIPELVLQSISVRWADKLREVDDLISEVTKSKVNAGRYFFI